MTIKLSFSIFRAELNKQIVLSQRLLKTISFFWNKNGNTQKPITMNVPSPNYKLQQVKGCNTPHHDNLWVWLLTQGRHQSDVSLNLLLLVVFPVFKPNEGWEKTSFDFIVLGLGSHEVWCGADHSLGTSKKSHKPSRNICTESFKASWIQKKSHKKSAKPLVRFKAFPELL